MRKPLKSTPRTEEPDEARRIEHRVTNCVVKRQRAAAMRYMLAPASADTKREIDRIIRKIGDSHCLRSESSFFGDIRIIWQAETLRYALADALVRQELEFAPLADLDRVADLDHPVLNEADFQPRPGKRSDSKLLHDLAESRIGEQRRIYLSVIGECVVRTDPKNARELLSADPTTPLEDLAFGSLTPALEKCIVAGQTLAFDKSQIRGTVAYSYYRLAKARRLSTEGKL